MADHRDIVVKFEKPEGDPALIREQAKRALGDFVKALARRQARIDAEEEHEAAMRARKGNPHEELSRG